MVLAMVAEIPLVVCFITDIQWVSAHSFIGLPYFEFERCVFYRTCLRRRKLIPLCVLIDVLNQVRLLLLILLLVVDF
jgi:hypothetical protein